MKFFPRLPRLPRLLIAATTLTAPFGFAHAQVAGPQAGHLGVTLGGGATWAGDSRIQDGGSTSTIPDLGTLNPSFAGTAGTVDLYPKSYDRAYDTGWNGDAELDYGLSNSLEAYGRVGYESLPGRNTIVGSLAGSGGEVPVLGRFTDLDTWNFSLGERYYLLPGMPIRPFVALGGGVAHMEEVNATYAVPDVGSIATGRYFTNRNGFYGDAGLGLAFAFTPRMDVKVGVDAEYYSSPGLDGAALTAAGVPALSASQPRWLVPVTVGLGVKF